MHSWFSTDEDARWEPMFEAQRMLHEDRPFIIVAGPHQIQAYRNDRFEFPLDTFDDNFGMFTPQGLLDATVPEDRKVLHWEGAMSALPAGNAHATQPRDTVRKATEDKTYDEDNPIHQSRLPRPARMRPVDGYRRRGQFERRSQPRLEEPWPRTCAWHGPTSAVYRQSVDCHRRPPRLHRTPTGSLWPRSIALGSTKALMSGILPEL